MSCYHVLCRPNLGPFVAGEPVFQPTSDAPIVANVQLGDITLDALPPPSSCPQSRSHWKSSTSQVEIELVPGFHPDYELSAAGDSGAVWVTRASCQPVALHTGLKLSGAAAAVSRLDALAALNLQPI